MAWRRRDDVLIVRACHAIRGHLPETWDGNRAAEDGLNGHGLMQDDNSPDHGRCVQKSAGSCYDQTADESGDEIGTKGDVAHKRCRDWAWRRRLGDTMGKTEAPHLKKLKSSEIDFKEILNDTYEHNAPNSRHIPHPLA